MARRLLAAIALALLAGARCADPAPADDVPAVLEDPSHEARAELRAVLGEALGQADVLLAPDAWTRESALEVERSVRGDLSRTSPGGRSLDRPELLLLVLNRGTCYVVRPRTQERWPLRHARCRPEPE